MIPNQALSIDKMMQCTQIKKLGFILLLILVGIFISSVVYITLLGIADNVKKADVIVVLGNQIEPDGKPSPRLRARLDKALQLYQQGLAPAIIVSGGIEPEGFDEARIMKSYLVQNGVPDANIYLDSVGDDTYKTAQNVSQMMDKHQWNSVIVVSQFYHIARSKLAFERFGVPQIYSAHADFFELRDLYSLGREVFALLAYQVRAYE